MAEMEERETTSGADQEARRLSLADILAAWEAEVVELQAEIERWQGEVAGYRQQMIRLQADFDNFRKRKSREEQELSRTVTEKLFKKLLPILDNLERALEAPVGDGDAVSKGIDMTLRQLQEVLQEEGVTSCGAEGEAFNPEWHHAVARVETTDYPEGTVVDELQKGYLFRDRLLRPALVRVAVRPAEKVVSFISQSDCKEVDGDEQSNRN